MDFGCLMSVSVLLEGLGEEIKESNLSVAGGVGVVVLPMLIRNCW